MTEPWHNISDKHNRHRLEERKRCQLLMEVPNYHSGMPPPDAGVVYRALNEGLGLSKDPSQQDVKAIYQPDPQNPWIWVILFASEAMTNKYQGQETTVDNNNFSYTFITNKTVRPLMITVQSTPLITDDELGNAFKGFGEIVRVVKQGHQFAKNIDSGLRKIFLTLNNRVQTRDIPGSIRTSDGVGKKLFFKGKLYFWGGCGMKHTYTRGCPISRTDKDQHEQTDTQQEQTNNTVTQRQPETVTFRCNRKESARTQQHTEKTRNQTQKPETVTFGRNRTDSAQTEQNTENTRNHTQTEQHTENIRYKEADNYNIAGTPTSREEDFPLSPSLVSS